MYQSHARRSHPRVVEETPNSTSLTLIDRIRVHDNEAWQRLVTLYTPFLHYWCRRWGVSSEDADDVLQEVFQAISKSLEGFRRDREGDSFRSWLRGIARNKVLSLQRRRDPRGPGGTDFYRRALLIPDRGCEHLVDTEQAEEDEAVGVLYQQALKLVRSEFEERTWQAFWRAAVEGQSPAIIAEDLGVTAAAVRQAKSRILRKLKEILGETSAAEFPPGLPAGWDNDAPAS
jgi:RNA polymerase sigma-70 factor, ECF subfamily